MHVIVLKFGLPLAPRRVQIVARGGVGKTLFKKKCHAQRHHVFVTRFWCNHEKPAHSTGEAESPVCGHRTVLCNEQRLCVCACVRAYAHVPSATTYQHLINNLLSALPE